MTNSQDLGQRLLAAAEAATPKAETLLAELIRFRTVNGEPGTVDVTQFRREVARCFAYLGQWCRSHGMIWRQYDELVAVAEIPGEGPEVIGVPLHIDVVPAIENGSWTHPPFQGHIDETAIHGRGAQDDKGPSAAMLVAGANLLQTGAPRQRTIRFIIGSTEESGGWDCMKRYLAEESAPDFTLVPDSRFPIVTAEKGYLTLDIRGKWPLHEGENLPPLDLYDVKAGVADNVVPPTASLLMYGGMSSEPQIRTATERVTGEHPGSSCKIDARTHSEWVHKFVVTVQGKAAHASTPHAGINAALLALEVVQPLFPQPVSGTTRFCRLVHRVAQATDGSGLGLAMSDGFVGATTACLAMVSVGDEEGWARINVRFPPGMSVADALNRVEETLAGDEDARNTNAQVSIYGTAYEPIRADEAALAPYLEALATSYTDITGRPATLTAIPGTTFAKAFPNAVCYGGTDAAEPGEVPLAHQVNELLLRKALARNVKIYSLALARLAMAQVDVGELPPPPKPAPAAAPPAPPTQAASPSAAATAAASGASMTGRLQGIAKALAAATTSTGQPSRATPPAPKPSQAPRGSEMPTSDSAADSPGGADA